MGLIHASADEKTKDDETLIVWKLAVRRYQDAEAIEHERALRATLDIMMFGMQLPADEPPDTDPWFKVQQIPGRE